MCTRLAVDGGEVAAEVDGSPVGSGADDESLGVERVREPRDGVAGGDVEGEHVVRVDLAGSARRDPRRPRFREAAGHVDRGADDGLAPDDAVDLPGRQEIHGDRLRRRRRGIGRRGGCGGDETAGDDRRRCQDGREQAGETRRVRGGSGHDAPRAEWATDAGRNTAGQVSAPRNTADVWSASKSTTIVSGAEWSVGAATA